MSVSFKLQARQTQSLAMTPQLVQSIRLLQMSSADLVRHVMEEMEKNPLLELDERGTRNEGDAEISQPATEPAGEGIGEELDVSTSAIEEKLGTSLENTFDGDRSGGEQGSNWQESGISAGSKSASIQGSGAGHGPELPDIQDYVAQRPTLRDHLGEQLAITRIDREIRPLCMAIINSLDENGYFRSNEAEFTAQTGASAAEFRAALDEVQKLEPCGIGARDLAECLKLQLVERNRFDPAMEQLIANLELLARRDFKALQRICEVDLEDLMEMVEEIRALDPRPARAFEHAPVQAIVPDVIVFERNDGSFGIELNPEALPRVLVNQTYRAIVDRSRAGEEEKAFVIECLNSANWLVRSIEQRAQTILKVMAEIVKRQDAFFVKGIRHLRPISLRQVADQIGMHESTVSRVTSNKYVMTSRGMFELKFFFTAAIAAVEGEEAHSAEAVRHEIRDLIEGESADSVLSDDAIVEILAGKGIEIARRTVAKYREGMNIASSVQRRREKKAAIAISALSGNMTHSGRQQRP